MENIISKRGRGQPPKYDVPTKRISLLVPVDLAENYDELALNFFSGNRSDAIIAAMEFLRLPRNYDRWLKTRPSP